MKKLSKKKVVKVSRTIFPFMPKIRLHGEDVGTELGINMQQIARNYGLDTRKMTAKFEILPNPETDGETHFLTAEVVYRGHLKKLAPPYKLRRRNEI